MVQEILTEGLKDYAAKLIGTLLMTFTCWLWKRYKKQMVSWGWLIIVFVISFGISWLVSLYVGEGATVFLLKVGTWLLVIDIVLYIIFRILLWKDYKKRKQEVDRIYKEAEKISWRNYV